MKTQHLVLTVALCALTTACQTATVSSGPIVNRNPVQVAETVERLELYARSDGMELSARDRDAVAMFLSGYSRSGDGPLYVNVPEGANPAGTDAARGVIGAALARVGLSPSAIQEGAYRVPPGAPAPLVVSYRQLKAVPRDCRFLGDVVQTHTNQPYDGWGCFQSANLAAMVSDPRQLLEPYAAGISDSARRMVVYDKYIEGESTASDKPDGQDVSSQETGG